MSVQIQQQLRKAGLKVTQARVSVLKVLVNEQEQMTVKQVYQHLFQHDQKISLATIYRVINDLEIVGLITQNLIGRGEARYALPHTSEVKLLNIKCADLDCVDHEKLISSLQQVFQQFNANVLDVEFKTLNCMN